MNLKCTGSSQFLQRKLTWLDEWTTSVSSGGRVTRQVCFAVSKFECCDYQTNIQVPNCGNSFYVFKLKPTPICNASYCTQQLYEYGDS